MAYRCVATGVCLSDERGSLCCANVGGMATRLRSLSLVAKCRVCLAFDVEKYGAALASDDRRQDGEDTRHDE